MFEKNSYLVKVLWESYDGHNDRQPCFILTVFLLKPDTTEISDFQRQ